MLKSHHDGWKGISINSNASEFSTSLQLQATLLTNIVKNIDPVSILWGLSSGDKVQLG